MYKFNNGSGAVTCDCCCTIIATGHRPKLGYIYKTKKEEHIVDGDRDFCSKECQEEYKECLKEATEGYCEV